MWSAAATRAFTTAIFAATSVFGTLSSVYTKKKSKRDREQLAKIKIWHNKSNIWHATRKTDVHIASSQLINHGKLQKTYSVWLFTDTSNTDIYAY